MLDASVLKKLVDLVEKATSKRRTDVDPAALKQLKLLCRAADENVRSTFDLLMDQMKSQDAQVRPSPSGCPHPAVSCGCSSH